MKQEKGELTNCPTD